MSGMMRPLLLLPTHHMPSPYRRNRCELAHRLADVTAVANNTNGLHSLAAQFVEFEGMSP